MVTVVYVTQYTIKPNYHQFYIFDDCAGSTY